MIQLVLLLLFLLLAILVGSAVLNGLSLRPANRLEAVVYCAPIGLGIIAYSILAIGLLGVLYPGVVIGTMIALAVVAAIIIRSNPREASVPTRTICSRRRFQAEYWIVGLILALVAIMVGVNCFVPPGAHEWDALSYHLAVPKIYLESHRIVYLPTDHHSNFPFTMEMLFTLGLMFGGYALANLFHFACGVLCVAALFALANRRGTGWLAAGAFATSPIVLWEAGAAYIEMGLALFVITAFGAAMKRTPGWIALAGILMGFALSVKALALVPFALLGFLLWQQRVPWRQRAPALKWYFVWAVVVGCPFYVKSWVQTGNPVYPFAYRLFGGKYWDTKLADAYAGEQRSFGQSANRTGVRDDFNGSREPYSRPSIPERIRNLALAPFDLVAIPRLFYNYNDAGVRSQLGFLFLPLALILLLAPRLSRSARMAGWLALLWLLVWSQTMQYVRYLIPLLALFAVAGSESVARLARRLKPIKFAAVAAVVFQAALTLAFFSQSLPEQWARAIDPETREAYLKSTVRIYQSQQWINSNAPPDAQVVLWEETRGYYLDRPYLWGNSPHSLYIPYETMKTGSEMSQWFLKHGVHFALLNLQFAPQATADVISARRVQEAAASNAVAGLTLEWYSPKSQGEPWRHLLGDALQTGAAVVRSEGSYGGAVVIEFRASPNPTTQQPTDPTTHRPNDLTTQRPNDPPTQRPN